MTEEAAFLKGLQPGQSASMSKTFTTADLAHYTALIRSCTSAAFCSVV